MRWGLFLFIFFIIFSPCTVIGTGLLFTGWSGFLGGLILLAFNFVCAAMVTAMRTQKDADEEERRQANRAIIEMNERQKREE